MIPTVQKSPKSDLSENGKKSKIKSGDTVNGKFMVFNCLGQGGFGAVFEVYDCVRNEVCALKMEFAKMDQDPGLEMESGALKRLQHSSYFPRLIECGKYNDCNFVVMQLVGRNLSDLRRDCENKFSLGTSLKLAINCLKAVEAMHASGMLHRDIKPNNFTIGNMENELRQIYLLDFGLVRRFLTKDNAVRQQRASAGFRGTIKYCSPNVHQKVDQGRNDDLCSWLYMTIEFMKGTLPWSTEIDKDKVGELKATTKERLISDLPPEIGKIYDSVIGLRYSDDPPYHLYKSVLAYMCQIRNFNMHQQFDWETEEFTQKTKAKNVGSLAMKKKEEAAKLKKKKDQSTETAGKK